MTSIVGFERASCARACTVLAVCEQIWKMADALLSLGGFVDNIMRWVTHAGCTTSSQNICVQSRTGLVPSAPTSASGSAICQRTSLSMSPSKRPSRMPRGVVSSSSSEDCCTLRLFCACDRTGIGRTETGGHGPGRESFRRWRSTCICTLRWVSVSV